jgi:hypothetical protein
MHVDPAPQPADSTKRHNYWGPFTREEVGLLEERFGPSLSGYCHDSPCSTSLRDLLFSSSRRGLARFCSLSSGQWTLAHRQGWIVATPTVGSNTSHSLTRYLFYSHACRKHCDMWRSPCPALVQQQRDDWTGVGLRLFSLPDQASPPIGAIQCRICA